MWLSVSQLNLNYLMNSAESIKISDFSFIDKFLGATANSNKLMTSDKLHKWETL